MLDLTIRHGAKALDDVMRTLYRRYYVLDRRGFADAEFRQACEAAAGRPLAAVFRERLGLGAEVGGGRCDAVFPDCHYCCG